MTTREMAPGAARIPMRILSGFEGGPGSSGSAECTMPVSNHDLAIRPEINEGNKIVACEPIYGDHARQNVTAHEAAQAR